MRAVAGTGLARRSMSQTALVFIGVAASAPMTSYVGGVNQAYGGTGVIGVPLAFVFLMLVLGLLTVGTAAMARHVPSSSPLYTLLARGLGAPWGVAGGIVAVLGYAAVQVAMYALLAVTAADFFGGPWQVWILVVWLTVGLFGILRVTIAAGVVAVLLIVEIALIVLTSIGGLANPAGGHITVDALQPSTLMNPQVGGVLALCIASYIGFESILGYGEEARTARAMRWTTLTALALIGVLLAVGAWALSVYVGPEQIVAAAQSTPNLPITVLVDTFGVFGPLLGGVGTLLLITSVFAGLLSFQGAGSRYLFAAGRERLLPAVFARTGTAASAGRDAPIGGSVLQSAITGAAIAVFVVAGADPITQVFTWPAALAAVAILAALIVAAGASVRYFHQGGGGGETAWTTTVLPAAGILSGALVWGTTVLNLATLLGVAPDSALRWVIPGVVGVAGVAGLGWAAVIATARPQVYAGIGHGRPDPLAIPDERLKEIDF